MRINFKEIINPIYYPYDFGEENDIKINLYFNGTNYTMFGDKYWEKLVWVDPPIYNSWNTPLE